MTAQDRDPSWYTPLVTQLFVTWVSSREGVEQISNLIQEVCNELHQKGGTLLSTPSVLPNNSDKDVFRSKVLKTRPPLSDSEESHLSEGDVGSSDRQRSEAGANAKRTVGIKTTQFVVSPIREASPPPIISSRWSRSTPGGLFAESTSHTSLHPAPTATPASFEDIPLFYSRNLSQGILPAPSEKEIALLDEMLSIYKENGTPIKKEFFFMFAEDVFKIPLWMKDLLYDRIVQRTQGKGSSDASNELTYTQVSDFFRNCCAKLAQTRRLFEIIKRDPSRNYITLEDLKEVALYLANAHEQLQFFAETDYQEGYAQTVAIRIMYALEHQQAKKIFWQDFNRSSLPDVLYELDVIDMDDELQYFSYQHFYVLYCKFWELDTDRDLRLNYFDMRNYGEGMLAPLVIRRVVDGYGRALSSGTKEFLDYEDFIYFCLSEEDKNSQAAVYYWFKVLDLDADGLLSGYELASFFTSENQQRLTDCFGSVDPPSYEDMMCQMLDMLGVDPQRLKKHNGGLTLADFRACPTPANFFNMIFNAEKFFNFECRDPFLELQKKQGPEQTDWDRFASAEYKRMSAMFC